VNNLDERSSTAMLGERNREWASPSQFLSLSLLPPHTFLSSMRNDSSGRTLASSARSTSNLTARSPLAAPNAAALAALSRATGSLSLEDDLKPMYWEKKDWFRLIDDEVSVSL